MSELINSEEKLYRYVIPKNWQFIEKRVCSALFKDSKGVSVDRAAERHNEEMVSKFILRFGIENVQAVVYVIAEQCHKLPARVNPEPVEENEHHSVIYDMEQISLTQSKARRLASQCMVVYVCA